jgi:hypothetical protein
VYSECVWRSHDDPLYGGGQVTHAHGRIAHVYSTRARPRWCCLPDSPHPLQLLEEEEVVLAGDLDDRGVKAVPAVLGLGVSGRAMECITKATGKKGKSTRRR